MKQKIFLMTFLFSTSLVGKNFDVDPNSYFSNRSWSVEVTKLTYVFAKSTYQGEPVQKPNNLFMELRCPGKKKVPMVKSLKYCGLDSISMVGNKLEIMFVDYNYKDKKGYCTKKRKQYFPIPSCSKALRKKHKKSHKK